ncbi:uncharacterized protein TNCV_4889461 [Trichonephila clavipes]|nr:uncharacterized protein TNCV_4889461 [Trichonephila clavipes]
MPVYQRLASNEILLRCVSGKTQNANESLHSCIWRKCPKDVFVSKKRINLAVTAAVSEVNIGYVETLKLNNNEMVDAAFKIAHRRDNRRNENQGGRLDGNESVADSFRSDLVGFKSWSGRIIGAFPPSYDCQKKPPVGKRTRYPRSPLSHSS